MLWEAPRRKRNSGDLVSWRGDCISKWDTQGARIGLTEEMIVVHVFKGSKGMHPSVSGERMF